MTIRKPAIIAAAIATAACFSIPVLSGTAQATTAYEITSQSSPYYCMQEYGTTSGLYLDPCQSNSSDYWKNYSGDANEYQNAHSQLCITYEGINASVDLQKCGDHANQDWIEIPANGISGPPQEICLGTSLSGQAICLWQSNKSVVARNSVNPNNVHDLWNF